MCHQALIFDARYNRLLVAGYEALAPLVAVSLPDGTVSDFVSASPGDFDGITIDRDGYVYTSLYNSGLVYRWEPDGSGSSMISWGHNGPAGLDCGAAGIAAGAEATGAAAGASCGCGGAACSAGAGSSANGAAVA